MGILDGIVGWIAEKIMGVVDFFTVAFLGALGCDMTFFLKVFPDAQSLYKIFIWISIGLIMLNLTWQLFKNFFAVAGTEAEDPIKLTLRSVIFIFLAVYANEIIDLALKVAGTPYSWITDDKLESISFADASGIFTIIFGVMANSVVTILVLIFTVVLAWNYLKLLFEAAERYVLVGIIVFTAPIAFAMGASKSTTPIFHSWCRMLGGQLFLLIMNAWCLKLFVSMLGNFIANPFGVVLPPL